MNIFATLFKPLKICKFHHNKQKISKKSTKMWYYIPVFLQKCDIFLQNLCKNVVIFSKNHTKAWFCAREYENALNWLVNADLVSRCFLTKKCAIPLRSYQDLSSFKIYLGDIGLLRQLSGLSSSDLLKDNPDLAEFKGALTENYIENTLRYSFDNDIYYYTFDRNELDFVVQVGGRVLPIEVKSGTAINHPSLTKFNANHDNPLSIVFSLNNIKKDGKILNLPLYLAEYLCPIVDSLWSHCYSSNTHNHLYIPVYCPRPSSLL